MRRAALLAIAAWLTTGQFWGAQRYPVTGLILRIDRPHRTFVVSCSAIPGYMERRRGTGPVNYRGAFPNP
jgi:hypothetical protein